MPGSFKIFFDLDRLTKRSKATIFSFCKDYLGNKNMVSIFVLGPMIISSILNQPASLAVNNISTLIDRPINFSHVYVKTEPVDDCAK